MREEKKNHPGFPPSVKYSNFLLHVFIFTLTDIRNIREFSRYFYEPLRKGKTQFIVCKKIPQRMTASGQIITKRPTYVYNFGESFFFIVYVLILYVTPEKLNFKSDPCDVTVLCQVDHLLNRIVLENRVGDCVRSYCALHFFLAIRYHCW